MDRFDPFVKYADVYGDIINWEKDPMNKPQNQNKYFFSDGKTYYEQICKMLRLMSVFKEAFNQIYTNEDEISEAWENFVNNLSASVVEGSEPDVTLTWTDDSVNFEFTMVPGLPGEQGVGITSISFNSDYTMTIILSNGETYTSMSLKGETGPQGPQGETGSGLQILDVYATLADLQSAHPTGQPGDAYQVGSGGNYILYIWSSSQSAWVQAGTLGSVSPYTSAPLMDGTASAGSQNLYARGDHVHPSDTSRASKEELDALIKTSQALIDQSFTYRESPAIQDGLARIDKIKGNTLVWNQLVQNGNFSNGTTGWIASGSNLTVSNGIATVKSSNVANQFGLYQSFKKQQNHRYLIVTDVKKYGSITLKHNSFAGGGMQSFVNDGVNYFLETANSTSTIGSTYQFVFAEPVSDITNDYFTVQSFMILDITQNGSITSIDDFRSLYSLSYYKNNSGSLLSFTGTGIKTVGFNQWDEEWELGVLNVNTGANYPSDSRIRSKNYIPCMPSTDYYFYCGSITTDYNTKLRICWYDENKNFIQTNSDIRWNYIHTSPSNAHFMRFCFINENITSYRNDICINISSSKNATYEPYTESTLSLPISTYFPTGMKSAGSAYDELTPTRAITRVGAVDLGTLTWSYLSDETALRFFATLPSDAKNFDASVIANALCLRYPTVLWNTVAPNASEDKKCALTSTYITIRDLAYTDATTFKNSLSGVMLYYELAEESSVDVDLDLAFNAYEDGTEQLLPVNGSVPSTSPIIADMSYLSIDDAMAYILEKLESIPEQTEQRLEALEDDVADLQTDVGALQPAVSSLQNSVGNINTNIGQMSSTVAGHTASISDIQSDITDITGDVSDLGTDVSANTGMINQLTSSLASTDGRVTNLSTSVSGLDSTVTAQGTTVTALDSIITDISNNAVNASLGQHELGFVAAYVDATLPANTGTMVTIPKPTIFPSNYTPLFIVGMTTGSYNVSICSIPYGFGSGDSVTCRVWNHGSQQTTQITVYILCMRQRQSQ